MYPIPHHEYRRRLRAIQQAPDYRKVRTTLYKRPAVEHWADGCCQLRAIVYPDGWEAYGRKGVPGYLPRPSDQGKIAFQQFNEPIREPPKPVPPPPDVIDWAE